MIPSVLFPLAVWQVGNHSFGTMSQNSMRLSWSAEEVDEKLKGIMANIHDSAAAAAEEYGFGYDLCKGANLAGFKKVAEAMMAQGIV